MNNPLVPQLRADKNGKLVTRHVIDSSGTPDSGTSLPAPSLTSAPAAPEKTERQIAQDKRDKLMECALILYGYTPDALSLRNSEARFSFMPAHLLDTIDSMLKETPVYDTRGVLGNDLRSKIVRGDTFGAMLTAGSHELNVTLHQAGFEVQHSVSPKKYFGPSTPTVLRDSQVKDFNTWLLATHLGFGDAGTFDEGPLAHYRGMSEMADHFDEVLKALPVLAPMVHDEDNYMLEYGFEDIVRIAKHVAAHSETEIEKIALYVKNHPESSAYYEDEVDEMLADTEGTDSLTSGWL